jgi:predicted nucleotidyltransferase
MTARSWSNIAPNAAGLLVLDAMPVGTRRLLEDFVEATKGALGGDVRSIVLFGSGAEGRLRETSDVNVLVLLARFEPKARRCRISSRSSTTLASHWRAGACSGGEPHRS